MKMLKDVLFCSIMIVGISGTAVLSGNPHETTYELVLNIEDQQVGTEKAAIIRDNLLERLRRFKNKVHSLDVRNNKIYIRLTSSLSPKELNKLLTGFTGFNIRMVHDTYTNRALKHVKKKDRVLILPEDQQSKTIFLDKLSKKIKLPKSSKLYIRYELINNQKHPVEVVAVRDAVLINYNDIQDATIKQNPSGNYIILIYFTVSGSKKFAHMTGKANFGKKAAIIFNDRLQMTPVIMQTITSGKIQICGSITKEMAEKHITFLKLKPNPVKLTLESVTTEGKK